MTDEEFKLAVSFVLDEYCATSDNNLECDEDVPTAENCSEGDDGCWVKVWAFVPKDVYCGDQQ